MLNRSEKRSPLSDVTTVGIDLAKAGDFAARDEAGREVLRRTKTYQIGDRTIARNWAGPLCLAEHKKKCLAQCQDHRIQPTSRFARLTRTAIC